MSEINYGKPYKQTHNLGQYQVNQSVSARIANA